MTDAVRIAVPDGFQAVEVIEWVDMFDQRFFVHMAAFEDTYILSEYLTGRKIAQGSTITRAINAGKQAISRRAKARNMTPEQLIAEKIHGIKAVNQ